MKNSRLNIALLCLIIIYTSCNKITESIQQDIIVRDTVYFDIPVLSSITGMTTISEISSTFNLEKQIKENINNFSIDQVQATKLKSLNIFLYPVINTDSIDVKNNFGNLENVKFRISTGGNINDVANTSITSNSVIQAAALTPTIEPEALKPFLIQPSKTYSVIVKAKTVTNTTLQVAAIATYTVTLSK